MQGRKLWVPNCYDINKGRNKAKESSSRGEMTGNRAANDRWHTFEWRGGETEAMEYCLSHFGKFEVGQRVALSSFAVVSSPSITEQRQESGMHPLLALALRINRNWMIYSKLSILPPKRLVASGVCVAIWQAPETDQCRLPISPPSGRGLDQRIVRLLCTYIHYIGVWSTGSTTQELATFLQMKDPATEVSLYMWLAQALPVRSLVGR